MKFYRYFLISILVLPGCTSARNAAPAPAATQTVSAPQNAELPQPAPDDIRIMISADGPAVDLHCTEDGTQTVVTARLAGSSDILFSANADLMHAPASEKTFAKADDINFDGYTDVLIPISVGARNLLLNAWVWNAEKNTFEKVMRFDNICSYRLKPDKKEIWSFCNDGAAAFINTAYRIDGADLKPIRRITASPSETPGRLTLEYTHFTNQGSTQDTKTLDIGEKEYSAEMEDLNF